MEDSNLVNRSCKPRNNACEVVKLINFQDLPLDILLVISRCLEARDIVSLLKCSRHLAFMLSSHPVWYGILQKYIRLGIPIPPLHVHISDLSTRNLIDTVALSHRLRRIWNSSRPARSNVISFTPPPLESDHDRKPLRLAFLADQDSRYLLVGYRNYERAGYAIPYTLYCLNIGHPGSTSSSPLVEAKMELPGPVYLSVNAASESHSTFAIGYANIDNSEEFVYITQISRLSKLQTVKVDNDTGLPSFGFEKQVSFITRGIPLALSGEVLATGDARGSVWIYDIRTGAEIFELVERQLEGNETARVTLLSHIAIVFGHASIKIYELPEPFQEGPCHPWNFSISSSLIANGSHEHSLYPAFVHAWRWGPEMLTVAPFVHTHAPASAYRRPSFNLFVRFRSWYPWPINMVHQYVLSPGADGVYAQAPSLRLYTYSALDLFATSDAVLGRHGTVLWLDSYAEHGTVGGQRVAGKIFHHAPSEDVARLPETVETLNDAKPIELDPQGVTYDRGITMAFGTMERAEALKLALDEDTGRVGVGFVDGRVEIWEYLPRTHPLAR